MSHEFYRKIYERHSRFYFRHPQAKKVLIFANYGLTAAIFAAYAFLCLFEFFIHTPEWTDFLKILGIPLLCLLTVSLLRNLFDRKRPYEGAGIVPVIEKKKKGHSFPSRHLASAFVIGTVFLPYCLPAGIVVLSAGAVLGYVRFAAGVHYPSDLAVGALLGAQGAGSDLRGAGGGAHGVHRSVPGVDGGGAPLE